MIPTGINTIKQQQITPINHKINAIGILMNNQIAADKKAPVNVNPNHSIKPITIIPMIKLIIVNFLPFQQLKISDIYITSRFSFLLSVHKILIHFPGLAFCYMLPDDSFFQSFGKL